MELLRRSLGNGAIKVCPKYIRNVLMSTVDFAALLFDFIMSFVGIVYCSIETSPFLLDVKRIDRAVSVVDYFYKAVIFIDAQLKIGINF